MLIRTIDDLEMARQFAEFLFTVIILDGEHSVEYGFQATNFGT